MMFGEGWKPSTAGVETKRAQVSLGSLVVFEGPTSTENCSKVI